MRDKENNKIYKGLLKKGLTVAEKKKELEKKVDSCKERGELPVANIIVAGITGSGKSTLVNAVFGEEMAATGMGKPVTEHIAEYKPKDKPICIWDTVGFELDSGKTGATIKSIRETIRKKAESEDVFDRIHAIWYCIAADSHRVQSKEIEFIKRLYEEGVPFIIVITKCHLAEEETDRFENEIKNATEENGMNNIDIIQILAKPYKTRGADKPIPSFGLPKLIDVTLAKLPKFIVSAFAAAQKVNKNVKRDECGKIIFSIARDSISFLNKLIIVDIIPLSMNIREMLIGISKQYNEVVPDVRIDEFILPRLKDLLLMWAKTQLPIDIVKSQIFDFLEEKEREGFKLKNRKMSDFGKTQYLILYVGVSFVEAYEQVWDEVNDGQLKELKEKTDRLAEVLKVKFRNYK